MYTIGIDLGGTLVKIGLIFNSQIIDTRIIQAHSEKGLELSLPHIKEAIDSLLLQNNVDSSLLAGLGMAFPGIVDVKHCQVISTNEKYDDAKTFDLQNWCTINWNIPFYIDNDARMATIGEWCYGAGKGCNNLVMMTIGTGIGTGVVIDGNLLYGEHFQAGSLGGHFVIDYKGNRCSCGNIGCVEAQASSFFLQRIIMEHPDLSPSFKDNAAKLNFKEVFALAQEGDVDAIILTNECMNIWSAAIVTYIHAYDPQIIILGGGVMKSKEIILPYISERVGRLAWCPTEKVNIISSKLEYSAAILAAEYCLINKINKNALTTSK